MAVPFMAIAAGAQIGSTLFNLYGQKKQREAEQAALRAAREYNRKMARMQAKQELQKSEVQTRTMSDAAVRDLGELRANMAQNGFELDSGSNYSLLLDSRAAHQADIAQMRQNAEQRAWEHIMNGERPVGSASGGAGWQTAGTILGGLSSAMQMFGGK